MLVKLTPGRQSWCKSDFKFRKLNFTNILRATFLYESFAGSFLYLHFRFELFWSNNIGAKAALRMLAKLAPGVNFINILLGAFQPVGLR